MQEVLTSKEKKQLNKLLGTQLIELLNDRDTQTVCYEFIYEDFTTQEQPLTDELDRAIVAYLDICWESYKKMITEVNQLTMDD